MKKIFLMITLMFSIVMCGIEKIDDKEIINKDGISNKLVIGLDDAFAPMGFKNEKGEIVGFDIDLSREVAKRMGVEVEYKSINWDSKILDLNSGNIDLIWNGLTITPERKNETAMSKPYMKNSQVIVVRYNSDIVKKDDLKGKKVGSQNQSSGEEIIIKNGFDKEFKEFRTYAQYDQAFMDLDFERIDAVIVDEVFAKYIKNTKENEKKQLLYRILDDNYGLEEMGIAAKRGNNKLIDSINKIIEEMKADGSYEQIYNKWFKD